MKMKNLFFAFVLFAGTLVFAAAPAEKKTESREPASFNICIKHPTIECRTGYKVKKVKGCFVCVHHSVLDEDLTDTPRCIKKPTLTCETGFRVAQDAKGCYHCAEAAVTSPTCIRHPTLECIRGYHVTEDDDGCFHCTKE
jgi:hypothetical protein